MADRHPSAGSLGRPRGSLAGSVVPGLLTALVGALGVWSFWRVFVATAAGQRVDEAALQGADFGRTRLWEVAEPVLSVVSVPFVAVVLVVAVVIAALRRRWVLAVQAVVLVVGSNVTTQLLKQEVLHKPDLDVPGRVFNTLPSGHTTVAASVAAAIVLVVPPRLRAWAAVLGAGYTAATGVSTLIGKWHRPSDVMAGLCVVLAWAGLSCAIVASRSRLAGTATGAIPVATARVRRRAAGAPGVVAGTVLLGTVAVLSVVPAVIALRRTWLAPDPFATRATLLTAYAGGALGVVALCAATFAVLLVVRHLATAGSNGRDMTS